MSEKDHFMKLELAQDAFALQSKSCNCPKRCNVIDYHIFGDPAPLCQWIAGYPEDGVTKLFFSVPSNQVVPLSLSFLCFVNIRDSTEN